MLKECLESCRVTRNKFPFFKTSLLIAVVAIFIIGITIPFPPTTITLSPISAASDTTQTPSIECIPLGLHGDITSDILVDKLTEDGEDLVTLAVVHLLQSS